MSIELFFFPVAMLATGYELTLLDAIAFVLLLALVQRIWGAKRLPAPFPPGPKGYPLIGNLFDVPPVAPWLTFAEWGDVYGRSLFISLSKLISQNEQAHWCPLMYSVSEWSLSTPLKWL